MTARVFRLGIVLWALGGGAAIAQEPDTAASLVGQRIRVTFCERATTFVEGGVRCSKATGLLADLAPDLLRIEVAPDSVVTVDRTALRRIERSLGVRSHVRSGAWIGGGVGLAVGLIFSAAAISTCSGGDGDQGCGYVALGAPLVGAAVGFGIGVAIGSLDRSEQWSNVPLTELSLPGSGAPRVRLALRIPI